MFDGLTVNIVGATERVVSCCGTDQLDTHLIVVCNWLFLVASPLLDYSHNILRAWPFRPVHIKDALMIM